MLIIPALYLQHGKAISLYKGIENDQKKIYPRSPLNLARDFQRAGAGLLHIVDMDGSAEHEPVNLKLIRQLCETMTIPVEVGGGIRSMEAIRQCFEAGVSRVILGVSALDLIPKALEKYGPDRIIFGIKARREWVDSDSLPPDSDEVLEIAEKAVAQGITQIVYKDMERQGTLYHPNYDDVDRLILLLGNRAKIFASGGVVAMDDFRILNEIRAAGSIVSRALLEHKIYLKTAINTYEIDQDRSSLTRRDIFG